MKSVLISFKQLLQQMASDVMLIVICFAPFLCGAGIYFGIPLIEELVIGYFGKVEIIEPYYLIFDLIMGILSSMLFCFASAMIVLSELDDHIAGYLFLTPLGKGGYLISRFGIPTLISMIITMIILSLFSLTGMSSLMIIEISVIASIIGMLIAFMIVAIATNKVEGMVVSKLSGFLIVGALGPFFLIGNEQYLLSILPTFWMAKFAISGNLVYIIITLFESALWIFILLKLFLKKLA